MEVVVINETVVSKWKKGVGPWVRGLRKKRTELRNKGKTYVCPRGINKNELKNHYKYVEWNVEKK